MKYYSESGLELRYGTEHSAGLDLPFYDADMENVTLQPKESRLLKTGIHIEMPEGHVGILDTRSSSGKAGIDLMCRVIDCDYRGNIRLMVFNHSSEPITIARGSYIAQIVIVPMGKDRGLEMVGDVSELSETARGTGGFGSTGKTIKGE